MATYSLSGTGTQTLTTGTGALYVAVTTLPTGSGHGGANPTDYYGLGFIRPGNATAFWEPFPIIGGPQWMPVPSGTTQIGYALAASAVVSVTEVAGSSPLAFPLASLPDVAIASVADAQVLAYQASTSKWINATPAGGGGSGTVPTQRALVRRTSNQTGLSVSNFTNVVWQSEDVDTDTMVDLATNNERITIKTAGTYLFVFGGRITSNSSGELDLQIFRTRSAVETMVAESALTGLLHGATVSLIDDCLVNDYYRVKTWASGTSPTLVLTGAGIRFSATRIQN